MTSWKQHNNKVFKNGMSKHKMTLEKDLSNVMQKAAREIRDWLMFGQTPFYTGNMFDSTGLGVYINGTLTAYAPPPTAFEPQDYEGEIVWGEAELNEALQQGYRTFSKGIWVVAFSAVPYAFEVDAYGTSISDAGYFSEDIVDELIAQFKTTFAREFPNIAKQIKSA